MIKLYLLILTAIFTSSLAQAQSLRQYFDGADTNGFSALLIIRDTTDTIDVWQQGPPQKMIFDSAATYPNVMVTDTINNYPPNDTSSFSIHADIRYLSWGVHAIRWKQKLDYDFKADGGLVEYSLDTGDTWHSVFDDPYIYNFYGFDSSNVDTVNGSLAFTGTDTVWRDIWLCFDRSYFFNKDVLIKFTSVSDSVDNQREGWMMDNFMAEQTFVHTVKKAADNNYLKVYPTLTTGRVFIEAEKLQEYHIIESIRIVNTEGRTVRTYGQAPTKFFVDMADLPRGNYYINVTTNKRSQTFTVTLSQ